MALEVDQILLTLLIEDNKNPFHPNLVRFYSVFTFGRAAHVNGVIEKKKKKLCKTKMHGLCQTD